MTWEYIAGFFDGEGSIDMRSRNRSRLEMCQSEKQGDVLFHIQEFLSQNDIQSKMVYVERSMSNGSSPILRLHIYSAVNVYRFLVKLIPHLIVRKKRAEEAFDRAIRVIDRRNDSKDALEEAVRARLNGMKTREVWIRFHKGSKEVKMEIDRLETIRRG